MSETRGVYKAIVAVQADLAKEGISKDRTCTQGASYKFRGIDDIYNALSPLLSTHGLCILPRMLKRDCVERTSAKGNALFYTTVEAEFDFVCAADGSTHTVRTFGEAMDSGDKGTNKAMSAAYKYAAFQAFCIPTGGDNDTDNQTHEVSANQQTNRSATQPNKYSGKEQKYLDGMLDWVDKFTDSTLDMFISQWEVHGVKAMAAMPGEHGEKLMIAKREMEKHLTEKETKNAK